MTESKHLNEILAGLHNTLYAALTHLSHEEANEAEDLVLEVYHTIADLKVHVYSEMTRQAQAYSQKVGEAHVH